MLSLKHDSHDSSRTICHWLTQNRFASVLYLVIIFFSSTCVSPSTTFEGDHLDSASSNEILLTLPSSPVGHSVTLFHDSPLLRSRKRILPAGSRSNVSPSSPTSSSSSSIIPLEPIVQNQDFITDRVKMGLECRPKSMLLQMNFTEPFRGVVSVGRSSYVTFEQSQECALRGDGRRTYSLQIFHNRCLTRFDKKRGQFTNTLFVRYHPTLETGGDYSKTLVCKFGLVDFSVH